MKWYWKIFPWLMFDHYKVKSEEIVKQHQAIADDLIKKADARLLEIKRGNALIKTDLETEFAFECDGEDYFKLVNDYNTPIERVFAAMDIYVEYDERCERVYHQTAYKAIHQALEKVEISKCFIIIENALERMDHITNIDLIYKLASVMYIDKHENPYRYDAAYNMKKIEKWKKSQDIESFFLKLPIGELIPSFNGLEVNIQTYTQQQRKDTLKKLKFHLSQFSPEERKSDTYLQAKLLEGTLEELLKLDA
jgi:hypothetical protein